MKEVLLKISASEVKKLREKTGCGFMEGKKALLESNGNIDDALLWLRKNGLSRAAKKSERSTTEGIIDILVDEEKKSAIILEINCETDFVARNTEFQSNVAKITSYALQNRISNIEELQNKETLIGKEIENRLNLLISQFGENVKIKRIEYLELTEGIISGYVHMGAKVGSLVALAGTLDAKSIEIAKDLAMQVVASSPKYISSEEIPEHELERERLILKEKSKNSNKPTHIQEKIVEGQMTKFYQEICLLNQPFIKDSTLHVKEFLKKESNLILKSFIRYQLGSY